jgi:hypothetical protein
VNLSVRMSPQFEAPAGETFSALLSAIRNLNYDIETVNLREHEVSFSTAMTLWSPGLNMIGRVATEGSLCTLQFEERGTTGARARETPGIGRTSPRATAVDRVCARLLNGTRVWLTT